MSGEQVMETAADVRAEYEVAKRYCDLMNLRHPKLSLYPRKREGEDGRRPLIDFDIHDTRRNDAVVAHAEIKDRSGWQMHYGTVYFAVNKWRGLVRMTNASGRPGFFVIRAIGRIFAVDAMKIRATAAVVGRSDRPEAGLTTDLEPCVLIPITDFDDLGQA